MENVFHNARDQSGCVFNATFLYLARLHFMQELLGLLCHINLLPWSAEQCSLTANGDASAALRHLTSSATQKRELPWLSTLQWSQFFNERFGVRPQLFENLFPKKHSSTDK